MLFRSFRQGWLERVLPQAALLLAPDGIIYAESETALLAAQLATQGLHLERAGTAGQVHYHLLTLLHRGPDPA